MAKREFNLPGIQDLSKEQEDARALPKQGQHLIIGGPGTGKSVLALLRSRHHQQDKDDYIFLVYNTLLNQASDQLFSGKLESQQWQAWFGRVFEEITNIPIPRLDENGFMFDWIQASNIIAALPRDTKVLWPFLIIDEGQDMPPAFYHALISLDVENFYVVADQNQQIVGGQNSTRQDIQNSLAIATEDVIELQENYRNNYPIARLAREFYTGDPASPPPELPNRPSTIRPLLFEYKDGQFEKIIERILKNADAKPSKLFGIIAPDNEVRKKYYDALKNATIKLDNALPRIETYANGANKSNLSFDEGGIMVINDKSCKGLEFDTVFLADINEHKYTHQNQDQTKRRFYVMVARAKEQIIMLKKAVIDCPVEAILTKNIEILERK